VADRVEIVVVEHPAQVVAERLAEVARTGGHVALTGGRTPSAAYELAARLEPDWTRAELWWGDERCVPPDDERSNFALAERTLLRAIRPGGVHRIHGELGRDEGARRYDDELGSLARFDLVLLGLGPDGHVASLFPDEPTLEESDRRAVGAEARLEPYVDRVTLTLPMLRAARTVLFLVTGEDKADAVKRAFVDEPSRSTPGSLVRAQDGDTVAVLDAAAARHL
jgi:6-phosphogluconolactonase